MKNWFMNFCAPFLPNDPGINFHRGAQSVILLFYTFLYISVYLYFLYCKSQAALSQEEENIQNPILTKQIEQKQCDSQNNSSENKQMSIKCDEAPNQSCIELKKKVSPCNKSTAQTDSLKIQDEEFSLETVKQYFAIVYGHFAVSTGISIMYTPYAQQSIACLLYVLLTIPLLRTSFCKSKLGTGFIWQVMVLILIYLLICGLLEVGQSNWDVLNLQCFSNEYMPLY